MNDADVCSICLEPLGTVNIIETRCNHKYHKRCLENWEKNTCPMCRHEYLDTYAWYSQKQFDHIKDHRDFPYIFYDIIDDNNNQKTVQITEIGTKSLFDDAIRLGTVVKFNRAVK